MKNQIRKARKAAGMTQERLAKAIGVTHATLSRYESGAINPPMYQFQAIADTLGVSLSELAGWEQIDRFTLAHEAGPEVYRKLEENYQRHHIERSHISMEESNRLLVNLGFIQEGEDLSDADLAFLENIIGQLDIWFSNRQKQPETTPQSSLSSTEGKDTTPPQDAPETPPEGE